jgi:RNA polymerase-binding transcription factor DksA
MNEQQTQAHRQRLLAKAERLKGDLPGLRGDALRGVGGGAGGNLSNVPQHLGDLANDTFEHEMAVGLLESEEQVMGAITTALNRLDAGAFGRCEWCGREIAEGRLTVLPYASRCIGCERQAEQEEARHRGRRIGV